MKYKTKSMMVGRKPRVGNNKYKTAVIGLFDANNPHKIGAAPTKVLDFQNIEKVRIRNMNVSYYLEGNDIIINDLEEVDIIEEDHKIIIKGRQENVEKRR